MGTYVEDKYVQGMMTSTGCSVEQAVARANKDPENVHNTGLPSNDYIEKALDTQFKKDYESYKNRNLRFYKLLGQNYESLVNGILRGKDIVYPIPKRYEMNTKHPFVLDWLLLYGRPSQIASVRQMGPVKLMAIYNALLAWIEQNPSEASNWVYEKEWRDYFSDGKIKKKVENKSTKIEKVAKDIKSTSNKKEETPMDIKDMLPELKFFTKRYSGTKQDVVDGDIALYFSDRVNNKTKHRMFNISIRPSGRAKIKGDCIALAVLGNRFYIKEYSKYQGYKLTHKNNNWYVQLSLIDETEKAFTPFAGKGYELKFDKAYGLWYGELEE
jgi:hypothetical protein